MEWTGITNENEYYSAYFLSEGLADSLKEQLSAWDKTEEERKAEAQKNGLKEWELTPGGKLRRAARELLEKMAEAHREKSPETRLLMQREVIGRIMEILDLPMLPAADLRGVQINGPEHCPLPMLGELLRQDRASEPVLRVFQATDLGAEDLDGETDPLEMFVHETQIATRQGFALSSKQKTELQDNWNKLLEKQVMVSETASRWVILAGPESWILLDRTKFARHSLLRFNWKELFSRREERVLNVVAALLHRDSMLGVNGKVLLDNVDEDAHKQASGVSDSLKKSLRRAIELLGNEAATQIIDKAREQKKAVKRDANFANDLTVECLRYMYRILFLLFVEARADLKYAPVASPVYQSGYSIESLRELESKPLLTDEDRNGRYFNDTINKLVSFFSAGTANAEEDNRYPETETRSNTAEAFIIQPLKGSLFDMTKTPYLNKVVFSNETLQKVIQFMSLSEIGTGRGRRQGRGRISYAHLGIHQLGAVYEALLSYRGFFAQEDLYEVSADPSKNDEFDAGYFVTKAELESGNYSDKNKVYETNEQGERRLKVYPKETFIYRLTGREREKSASYYTPEVLTQCLVKYALKEYWETVIDKLPTEKDKAEKILSLRICEPAMGSATFLNEAINQLAVRYMEHAQKAADERLSQDRYNTELQRVKMYLADNCVFGVDLNPVAVELAQVSLWLNALSDDKFVPWFGLQLQCGNSLIGCRRRVCKIIKTINKSKKVEEYSLSTAYEIGARKREENEVWQFLAPDQGMIAYKDPDMKKVYPEAMKTLADKRRAFNAKWREDEIYLLKDLSDLVDQHWDAWANELAELRLETTDPYSVYGHEAVNINAALDYQQKNTRTTNVRDGDGSSDTGHFLRLRLVMDYWCALWFWPIEDADNFPSREEYLAELGMFLQSEVLNTTVNRSQRPSFSLFDQLEETDQDFAPEDAEGRIRIDEIDNPHLKIVRKVTDRLRFFHWPLRFADILLPQDEEKEVGFDLTFGNPPWRVASWNSSEVIGDFLPFVIFKKESASTIRTKLLSRSSEGNLLERMPEMASAWRHEYEEAAGTQSFLTAIANYPETEKSATDLFKFFLPISWGNSKENGVQGFLHPLTVFTETNGDTLRFAVYSHLRKLFQFQNELQLFPVGNRVRFSIAIYGKGLAYKDVCFDSIVNLYHPRTIDDCYAHDGSGDVEGTKDSDGKWNLKGHRNRIIKYDRNALSVIAKIFGGNDTAPLMPNIHCESIFSILNKFSKSERRIGDIENITISQMWHETAARVDGTIREFPDHETRTPMSSKGLILNGPHLQVGNPLFKTPNNPCLNHRDWSLIDLEAIPDDFIPRAKYIQSCTDKEYEDRQIKCEWDRKDLTNLGEPFSKHVRVAYRSLVGMDSERTMTGALYPPGIAHVHKVESLCTKNIDDLLSIAASFISLPIDAFVRQIGKTDLNSSLIKSIPFVDYGVFRDNVFCRVLGLNCLTKQYNTLWTDSFRESFRNDSWSNDLCCTEKKWFEGLTKEWGRNCSLRKDLVRRQALLEIDVLTAISMGLSFKDLVNIYQMRFPVLKSYEENTYYDQNGRIVNTNNMSLSGIGLPWQARSADFKKGISYSINGDPCYDLGLGFENIKGMESGYVDKTFYDSALTDGSPQSRTIRYVAPFFKMDRENDYRDAWTYFSKCTKNEK